MTCLLCDGRPSFVGVFTPNDQAGAGAPGGKTRAVAYCLCAGCAARPEAFERVETIILGELAAAEAERN